MLGLPISSYVTWENYKIEIIIISMTISQDYCEN